MQRGSTDKYLWLEYRQPSGNYDPLLALISGNIYNGALIHYEDPEDVAHAGHTELLDFNPQTYKIVTDAVLDNGRTWTDPYSNLSITVNSATSAGLNVSVNYSGNCATISPTSRSHGAGAENGTVGVTAANSCSWTAVPSDPWIGISSGGAGPGSGTVNYSSQRQWFHCRPFRIDQYRWKYLRHHARLAVPIPSPTRIFRSCFSRFDNALATDNHALRLDGHFQ